MSIDRDLLARLRYLVVEDQGFQRWVIAHTLEMLGAVKVFSATNGQAALEILDTLDPGIDVVVTDLNMPAMDGIEFIRHLGKSRRPVGLIVASEQDPALIASVALMARAYGVRLLDAITKPVTTKKLADALARIGTDAPAGAPAPPAAHPSLDEVVHAVGRGEIEPFFQAKVSTESGEVVGAEAFARWRHPRQGILMPAAFIGTLESAGQLDALTMTMLSRSARACRAWRSAGFEMTVAVNISQSALSDTSLADRVFEAILQEEVEPRHVVLEVTETATSTHLGKTIENLSRLRMRGFGLSIDDYGTGYSSMQQLTQLPFTELKVDQSFVREAPANAAARAVLESSLDIARKLGVTAVAEGVESKLELNLVRELGCPLAQGYYIARPMSADAFTDWMIEARSERRARPGRV